MKDPTPRYLVPLHPKRIAHQFVDVLIIGSGLAGLRAASAISADLSVILVTKDSLDESNSNYAQGGIAGVLDPADCFADHVDDTIDAGAHLCNREIVEMVIHDAPRRIEELIQWGTQFDKEHGDLALGREGGHRHDRIVHARGDATGAEVMRAMTEHLRALPNVDVVEDTFTLDLLTHQAECRGAVVWNRQRGMAMLWAKQTILCTGGAGQIYRETTNPRVATADGHAMAYRAGAELRDMEFMQFHPTALYIAGGSRHLITEAARGEGAYLVDCHGQRFMKEHHVDAELAPRDVVSRAIIERMKTTHHPSVYLDLTHLDAARVRARFPNIGAKCAEFALDITKDRIPVRPAAHYMIGGLSVDDHGRTTLSRLWAAGEASSSGLHGANRLASNSLLEALVYGARVGLGAEECARGMPDNYQALPLKNDPVPAPHEPLDLLDIRNSLASLMGRRAGVERSAAGLREARSTIDRWCRYVLPRQFSSPDGWELQNMLVVSQIMVAAALEREESRGVHFRSDHPVRDDDNWQRHLAFRREETYG